MTCCHGIRLICGIKISKAELVKLLLEMNVEYCGKEDYKTGLERLKTEYYKESYERCKKYWEEDYEDEYPYKTYEEYIAHPDNQEFLNDDIDDIIDEWTYKFSEDVSIHDFEFNSENLSYYEYGGHYEPKYVLGFNIGKNSLWDDYTITLNLNDLSTFSEDYKDQLEELNEIFSGNTQPQIIAVMSGCGCCS